MMPSTQVSSSGNENCTTLIHTVSSTSLSNSSQLKKLGGHNSTSIQVVSRFRPQNELEKSEEGEEIVEISNDRKNCTLNTKKSGKYVFSFDHIFPMNSTQEDIYHKVGHPMVQDIFNGYNGTIFVYGQTSSGKTFTMMGPNTDLTENVDHSLKGLTPRMIESIFEGVQNADSNLEFTIQVSYLEIYLEKLRDLLDASKSHLKLKEDRDRGIYVQGLEEVYVTCSDEVFSLMKRGTNSRMISETRMNSESSRSHSIFIVKLNQRDIVKMESRSGRLYLVDLAGSEKVKKTGAEGKLLEEAKNINKSLSVLGNVINALTDGKSSHIPYRDSKLTRLLQDSLGGNSRTTLIINCSSSSYNEFETLSTLRFGVRAKNIKNKPVVNRELSTKELKKHLEQAKIEINRQQQYISSLEEEINIVKQSGKIDKQSIDNLPSLSRFKEQILDMEKELEKKQEYINRLEEEKEQLAENILELKEHLESKSSPVTREMDLCEYNELKIENNKLQNQVSEMRMYLDKEKFISEEKSITIESLKVTNASIRKDLDSLNEELSNYKTKYLEKMEAPESLKPYITGDDITSTIEDVLGEKSSTAHNTSDSISSPSLSTSSTSQKATHPNNDRDMQNQQNFQVSDLPPDFPFDPSQLISASSEEIEEIESYLQKNPQFTDAFVRAASGNNQTTPSKLVEQKKDKEISPNSNSHTTSDSTSDDGNTDISDVEDEEKESIKSINSPEFQESLSTPKTDNFDSPKITITDAQYPCGDVKSIEKGEESTPLSDLQEKERNLEDTINNLHDELDNQRKNYDSKLNYYKDVIEKLKEKGKCISIQSDIERNSELQLEKLEQKYLDQMKIIEDLRKETDALKRLKEKEKREYEIERDSLLKDLRNRCDKVVELEIKLDESREQNNMLLTNQKNKKIVLLERNLQQITTSYQQIYNENSNLRLKVKLIANKLKIRNERISNLESNLNNMITKANTHTDKYLEERSQYLRQIDEHNRTIQTLQSRIRRLESVQNMSQSYEIVPIENSLNMAMDDIESSKGRVIKPLRGGGGKKRSMSSLFPTPSNELLETAPQIEKSLKRPSTPPPRVVSAPSIGTLPPEIMVDVPSIVSNEIGSINTESPSKQNQHRRRSSFSGLTSIAEYIFGKSSTESEEENTVEDKKALSRAPSPQPRPSSHVPSATNYAGDDKNFSHISRFRQKKESKSNGTTQNAPAPSRFWSFLPKSPYSSTDSKSNSPPTTIASSQNIRGIIKSEIDDLLKSSDEED